MTDVCVKSFPEFRYVNSMSYEDNYYRWKDMLDNEYKWYGLPYKSSSEARSEFRKQWGYKYTQKVVNFRVQSSA